MVHSNARAGREVTPLPRRRLTEFEAEMQMECLRRLGAMRDVVDGLLTGRWDLDPAVIAPLADLARRAEFFARHGRAA